MPDHYMWGPDYLQLGGDAALETWVALGYLAAKTEKINLGDDCHTYPFPPSSYPCEDRVDS
jgi:alkanesulfonate monooxygenase SsuD/methylene tetrahydromethanopterin reductase-like flavin-dependent oxidoreductase (luciferase family)